MIDKTGNMIIYSYLLFINFNYFVMWIEKTSNESFFELKDFILDLSDSLSSWDISDAFNDLEIFFTKKIENIKTDKEFLLLIEWINNIIKEEKVKKILLFYIKLCYEKNINLNWENNNIRKKVLEILKIS